MIQHSRKPAVAVLVAVVLAGVLYVRNSHVVATANAGTDLSELERAITEPDAGIETWLLYAQRLQDAKRFDHAALAYQRVLADDPYNRLANLQCATLLASTGNADKFYSFMSNLLLVEPRMALDIFGRPEARLFLAESRFQNLQSQAQSQSMD
jgi:hypothetical protein